MKPRIPYSLPPTPRVRTMGGAALLTGACLLLAACAGASSPADSSAPARQAAGASAPLAPGHTGAAAGGQQPAAGGQQPATAPVRSLTLVQTASLTIQATDVSRAAAAATQLAGAAGGYVSGENATISHAHPQLSTVSLTLRIPSAAYTQTLAALTSGRLGTVVSQYRRATDVTQTVADVTSRAASARAAIAQLRALLARAGSVSSLLQVQNQISTEEADLESLLSQQRALSGQTSYATVSLVVQAPPVAARHRQRPRQRAGFTSGLAAGWHALGHVTTLVLTAAGAALPFLAVLAVLALAGWRAGRWALGRRARPGTSG